MKLIGKKTYNCTNNGAEYRGITCHCIEPAVPPAVGELCVTFSVGDTKPGYSVVLSLQVGDEITPVYNRFGKVDDVVVHKIK